MKRTGLVLALTTSLLAISTTPSFSATCDLAPHSSLIGCSFKDVNLGSVDLSSSDLASADLTNANLSHVNLSGIRSGNIVGVPSQLPEGWQLLYGYLVGPGADLSLANFSNRNLTNANFVDANLIHANLVNANLTNADFDGANLTSVAGRGIQGTPLNLPNPWKLYKGILIGPTADLSGVNLGNINLNSFDISDANLNDAVFDGADLTDVDLTTNSIMDIALYNCNLTRTDFTGVDVEGIRATGVIGTPIGLPSNFRIKNGYLIGPYANLSSLDLSNINFSGTNLHHANLSAANLTGANLANMDLTQTGLTGVNLRNANITAANLTGVDLQGVFSSGLVGTPIGLSSEWQLYQGYLLGPRANLAGVDFSNKDLRDAHLKGVSFASANFSNANLAGVDLTGTNLSGALLNGTNLTGTNMTDVTLDGAYGINLIGTPTGLSSSFKILRNYLLGPKVNLNNADLSGLDLTGSDLSGVSLLYADLSNANLENANLTGSAIDHANLEDANLTNVISSGLTGTPLGLSTSYQLVGGKVLGMFTKTPTPTIQGNLSVGNTITAIPGDWDLGVQKSYQWYRNGLEINIATNSTYALQPADAGSQLSVKVVGTGTGGVTRTKTSLEKLIALGAMSAKAIKISGKASVGKTLTAITSHWVQSSTISYKWLLDGKAIKGANKVSLKLTAKQKGHKLTVEIKQTANGYKTLTKVTKPTLIK